MPKPFGRIRAFRGELLVESSGTAPESRSVLNSEELRAFVVQAPPRALRSGITFHRRYRYLTGVLMVRLGCGLVRLFSTPYIAATIGSVVIPSTTKITLAAFGSLAEAS